MVYHGLEPTAGSPAPLARRLQLYAHGAQLFVDDESTSATLDRHLLRSTAADCMDALLRYLAADLASDEGQEAQQAQQQQGEAGAQGPLSPGDRAAIVKQLGPDVKPAASAALEKLGGSSLEVSLRPFQGIGYPNCGCATPLLSYAHSYVQQHIELP